MLSVGEIKKFIENDASSKAKQFAETGVRYYEGDHDIKDYRIFFIDAEGKIQEDKTKSNIKISHPFFKLLVDQQTQYMLSGHGGFVKSDIPELQTELDAYFNENESFVAELNGLISGTVVKGWEYMYAYKNEDDRTAFQVADSTGVVEVREKETDDGCAYVIYWFVDRIDKDNKKIKRIQVWDKQQTWFFCQEDDGSIVRDDSIPNNPRPHILYQKDGEDRLFYDDYGIIPFFRLDNGKKRFSSLKTIKALIDDYDLMNAGLSNNIQDTNEALYVVKGFDGDNLDELHFNVRAKKLIGVGESGDVDIKTIDIPVSTEKLEQVKKWTAVGVKAAEMIYKESGMGEAKKNYVRKFLESKGYKLDIDTVDALIEATVREMQQEAFETTAVPSLPDAEDDEAEELI